MLTLITWTKDNWKSLVVFAAILLLTSFAFRKFYENEEQQIAYKYTQQLDAERKSHNEQIEKINKVIADGIEKQKQITLAYQQDMEKLQQQYEEKTKELEELRITKIKELTKKINQDPEGVLDDLAHKFGFEVIPAGQE